MEYTTAGAPVIRVGVIDDHVLVTTAIADMLSKQKDFHVTLQAHSGEHLLQQLKLVTELPDILLMDVSMKGMNGIEATRRTTALYPGIKIVALTAQDDERTIIQMIRAGCCAYLKKDIHPINLEKALREVYRNGKYHADIYHLQTGNIRSYQKMQESFTALEIRFLQLTCKGLTHREIGKELRLTPSAVDHYRAGLFQKLDVNKGITMVLEALRRGLIELEPDKEL